MNTPRLPRHTTITEFLTSVASAEDLHGAVSAAALAGGIGNSLLIMIAALPTIRTDSIENRTVLLEASNALSDVQEQLIEAIETETAVKLFAARNLPQASDSQRAERHTAIQFALRAAADVPLEVMRLCADALTHAETVARITTRHAAADIQLAVALLHAAVIGARSNLESKLSGLTDAGYIASVVDEIAHLTAKATTAAQAAESLVQVPPA
jgi:formiminotetrahydrofolate cyclodeaminase